MKARMLRARSLLELRISIGDNLADYRSGNFDHLLIDPALSFATEIEFVNDEAKKLKNPTAKDDFEPHNCEVMLKVLPTLTPYEAADERLWAMLSHTFLLVHARTRWPIPKDDDEAVKHIATHFFAKSQRALERDNVGSRLWWMGHLCARIEGKPLKDSLEVLLFRSDVRANIIERPTTAQSVPLFAGLLSRLAKSYAGKRKLFEREINRRLMTALNGLGGYKLFDALDAKSVEKLIDDIIAKDLGIASY